MTADAEHMDSPLELRIGRDEVLVLSRNDLGFRALLTLVGLSAETDVVLTDAIHERPLSEYADDLAHHWQGWEDAKEWQTSSGQLKLTSSHDAHGHITITVALCEYSGNGWTVMGDISMDAGQLEHFARDVRQLSDR